MNGVPATKIWIVRRGTGKAEVHPSPVVLGPRESFGIRNLTEVAVVVQSDFLRPARGEPSIPPGDTVEYVVEERTRPFFEYEVTLGDQYAEGGSKPGVIIDP